MLPGWRQRRRGRGAASWSPRPAGPRVGVGVGAAGAGRALTQKSVPVTTVTWEPACTWVGSMAMITAPEMELATAWAAARSAGVFAA